MLMIRPALCRFRCGSASRDIRAKNRSERWTAVAHCSSVAVWARASGGPPELLTMMSRRPNRSTVFATKSWMVSGRSRSPAWTNTSRPISFAALSRSACDRLQIATLTPSCASTSAHARPSPLEAPPTIATLSFSSRSIGRCYRGKRPGCQRALRRVVNVLLDVLGRRIVARVDRRGQERRRIVLPELAHVPVGVDHDVHEPAVAALDTADVDVDDRIAVGVEADRPLRRVGELYRAQRLHERGLVLDSSVDALDAGVDEQDAEVAADRAVP